MGVSAFHWMKLAKGHPKFLAFLRAADNANYLREGTVVDVRLRDTDGHELHSNLRLTCEDVEAIQAMRKEQRQ